MKDLSIIVPFYRGDSLIVHLLQSIRDSYGNDINISCQLIIVIDSTETELERVSNIVRQYLPLSFDLLIVKNTVNLGVAASRNVGLKHSHGNYLYFIDQDDAVARSFFYEVKLSIDSGYEFILLNGLITYSNKQYKDHRIYYITPSITMKSLITDDLIRSPGQVILKKLALNDLNFPVPQKHFGSDDKYFWILIMLANPNIILGYVTEPVYIAKIHSTNYSKDRLELQRCSIEMWEYVLSRYNTSTIDILIRRNQAYLKFILRKEYSLSPFEKIRGFYEWLRYFLKPNKLIRYFIKIYRS